MPCCLSWSQRKCRMCCSRLTFRFPLQALVASIIKGIVLGERLNEDIDRPSEHDVAVSRAASLPSASPSSRVSAARQNGASRLEELPMRLALTPAAAAAAAAAMTATIAIGAPWLQTRSRGAIGALGLAGAAAMAAAAAAVAASALPLGIARAVLVADDTLRRMRYIAPESSEKVRQTSHVLLRREEVGGDEGAACGSAGEQAVKKQAMLAGGTVNVGGANGAEAAGANRWSWTGEQLVLDGRTDGPGRANRWSWTGGHGVAHSDQVAAAAARHLNESGCAEEEIAAAADRVWLILKKFSLLTVRARREQWAREGCLLCLTFSSTPCRVWS
eukprot:6191290-Pleurochrysis_carterae.AAC.3